MAKVKISEMAPFSSSFTGDELFPAVQGGSNVVEEYRHIVSRVISVTRAEAEDLKDGGALLVGCLYEISGVHPSLYNLGTGGEGNTIVLRAASVDRFSEEGIGYFYEPKYSSMNAHAFNGVAYPNDGSDPYSEDEKAVWGGIVYKAISASLVNPVYQNYFELDNVGTDWEVVTFNQTDYNLVLQRITYDWDNDFITSRQDSRGNKVSISFEKNATLKTYLETLLVSDPLFAYKHPIEAFGWGMPSIKDNVVEDSLFMCVNNALNHSVIKNRLERNSTLHSSADSVFRTGIVENLLSNSTIFSAIGINSFNFPSVPNFHLNEVIDSTILFSELQYIKGNIIKKTSISELLNFGIIRDNVFEFCTLEDIQASDSNSEMSRNSFSNTTLKTLNAGELVLVENIFFHSTIENMNPISGYYGKNTFTRFVFKDGDNIGSLIENVFIDVTLSMITAQVGIQKNIFEKSTISFNNSISSSAEKIQGNVIVSSTVNISVSGLFNKFSYNTIIRSTLSATLFAATPHECSVHRLSLSHSDVIIDNEAINLSDCIFENSAVDFSSCIIPLGAPMRFNRFQFVDVASEDFTSATLVFLDFSKLIYKRPDGTAKIQFYNDSDVLTIAEITD